MASGNELHGHPLAEAVDNWAVEPFLPSGQFVKADQDLPRGCAGCRKGELDVSRPGFAHGASFGERHRTRVVIS